MVNYWATVNLEQDRVLEGVRLSVRTCGVVAGGAGLPYMLMGGALSVWHKCVDLTVEVMGVYTGVLVRVGSKTQ